MSTTTSAPTVSDRVQLLEDRLTSLRAERDQAAAETRTDGAGDVADRATNVEASIRVGLLEERIAALGNEIDALRQAPSQAHPDGVVAVGDSVVLDLGDGPESFVVGSVEQAAVGIETVTPTSPLGRAILGATAGTTVTYSIRPRTSLSATIVSVG